jgi:acylphosphatase
MCHVSCDFLKEYPMIQVHAYFSGIVQGVGFRYTVQRYATSLGVCGWVKKLPEGRVEMKAEGSREVLEELIQRILQRFDASIREKTIYWGQAVEGFKSFEITF